MADHAGTTRGGYEVANALGALWALAPRLARLCTVRHNYALAIQTYLRGLDFYCLQHDVRPGRLRIDTFVEGDKLIQRING